MIAQGVRVLMLLVLPTISTSVGQVPSQEALEASARESLGKLPELIEAGKGPNEAGRKEANTRLKLVATYLLTELNRPGVTDGQVDRTFQQIARIGAPALEPLDTFIATCKKLADSAFDRFGADADPVVRRLDEIRHRAELERVPLVALADPGRAQQEWLDAMDRQFQFAAENYGRDSARFGQAALEAGDAYLRLKRYEEAENFLNPAREAFAAQTGEASAPEIACLFRLALISRSRKQFDHARLLGRRWMERAETLLGAEHVSTAVGHAEFGEIEMDAGDFQAAADRFRRSVEVLRKAKDAPPSYLPDSLVSLGAAKEKLNRLDEAAEAYRENVELRRKAHGSTSREVADALHILGILERNRRAYSRAEPLLVDALRIRLELLGPEHLETGRSQAALGRFYRATGQLEKAEPLLRAVLATREAKLGADHPDTKAARGYLEEPRTGESR